jgi:hypothetical protein
MRPVPVDPAAPLSFGDLRQLLLEELRVLHAVPPLLHDLKNLLRPQCLVVEVELQELPQVARPHLYVVVEEHPVVLAAADQGKDEVALLEVAIRQIFC